MNTVKVWIVGVLILGTAMARAEAPDVTRVFNIPSQSTEKALTEFGLATGLQVLFSTQAAAERKSPAVMGELSAKDALERLLAETGLSYEFVNERTVRIAPLATAPKQQARETNAAERDTLALAQANVLSPPGEGRGEDAKSSSATESDSPAGRITEIIVTAQKRAERLIDVPISIVAFSSSELQKRRIGTVDDLSMVVPGLSIQSTGTQRRMMLRGVGNVFGSSSLIGLYLDEASVTLAGDTQLDLRTYDLERIEVLRGPQGTLYGDGSVGGTIRFVTKDPVLDRFELNADLEAAVTEDGAPSQRLQSVVNVPLLDNELGFRVVGIFDRRGGWMEQPAANLQDINDQDAVNVRVKGLWQPSSTFAARLTGVIHRNDEVKSTGEDADGNYTQSFNLTTRPQVRDDYEILNLALTYDFAAFQFLSTTSYINRDNENKNNSIFFQVLGAPPAAPVNSYSPLQLTGARVLSEELRLTSAGDTAWKWTAGVFYRRYRSDLYNPAIYSGLTVPLGGALPLVVTDYTNVSHSNSGAVFGDTSYQPTQRLTLGVGLRYFEDEQDSTTGFNGTASPEVAGKFHATNPRAYAQFKLAEQVNFYASATKGFRSGGFNGYNLPEYGPESVWTYELGTKMALPEASLTLDVSVFHSEYEDYLITGILPGGVVPIAVISNGGDAEIDGVEAAVTWRPTGAWLLSANGNYLDTEFTSIRVTSTSYALGDNLDLVPKYQYTASAQRDFDWHGIPGYARMDYNRQGRQTYRNRSVGPWYLSESAVIDMLNFSANLQWSDSLSFGVFGQNLLDDRGYTSAIAIENGSQRARPRTYGVQFAMSFR